MAIDERLDALAQRIQSGSKLVNSWPLTGGVSAQVTAFELRTPEDSLRKLVLRQYGEADVASNPNVAETEYRLLDLLHRRGIPVPEPRYFDSSRTLFPVPILVIDFVAGEPDFEPANLDGYLSELTDQLLRIHRAGASIEDVTFLPRREPLTPVLLRDRLLVVDESPRPDDFERLANESARSPNPPTLLHGDYWPGNIHWKDGRIVAVIDWEDARLGDPLADIANSRLEILWAFGQDAMDRFTEHYRAAAASSIDFTALPYWDLCVAVGPAANYASWTDDRALTERRRLRLHRFIHEALEQL